MHRLLLALAAAAGLLAGAARADPPPVVEAVPDGDTLQLADGRVLRLLGIRALKPGEGDDAFARQARRLLESLARGKSVRLDPAAPDRDRYGRLLAQVELTDASSPDEGWLQGALVRAGLAKVYSTADHRERVPALLGLEADARAAGRGIWADRRHRVLDPDTAESGIGSFRIVEGVVQAAAVVKGRAYLNFGPDRRTDFTVSVAHEALPLFRAAGVDLAALGGRRVRARGWLRAWDGPLIEATHPEQIEVLE